MRGTAYPSKLPVYQTAADEDIVLFRPEIEGFPKHTMAIDERVGSPIPVMLDTADSARCR
jgi:hypothetical protein